ncbi:MAG: DUF3313 family protein [Verrucomicrobiota bacterium]
MSSHRLLPLGLLALAHALAGCVTSDRGRSDFLSRADGLTPSAREPGLWTAESPQADFSSFTQLLIEDVLLLPDPGSPFPGLKGEDAYEISRSFKQALRKELSRKFRIATRPGPEVLQVRAALAGLRGLSPLGSAPAPGRLPVRDSLLDLSQLRIELEVLDSRSGLQHFALIDTQPLANRRGSSLTWDQLRQAFYEWSWRFQRELDLARQRALALSEPVLLEEPALSDF